MWGRASRGGDLWSCTCALTVALLALTLSVTTTATGSVEKEGAGHSLVRNQAAKIDNLKVLLHKMNEDKLFSDGTPTKPATESQEKHLATNNVRGIKRVAAISTKTKFVIPGWNGAEVIRQPEGSPDLVKGQKYLKTLNQIGVRVTQSVNALKSRVGNNRRKINKMKESLEKLVDMVSKADPFREVAVLEKKFNSNYQGYVEMYQNVRKLQVLKSAIREVRMQIKVLEKTTMTRLDSISLRQDNIVRTVSVASVQAGKVTRGLDDINSMSAKMRRVVMELDSRISKDKEEAASVRAGTKTLLEGQASYVSGLIDKFNQSKEQFGGLQNKLNLAESRRTSLEQMFRDVSANYRNNAKVTLRSQLQQGFELERLRLTRSMKGTENDIMDELRDFIAQRYTAMVSDMKVALAAKVTQEMEARFGKLPASGANEVVDGFLLPEGGAMSNIKNKSPGKKKHTVDDTPTFKKFAFEANHNNEGCTCVEVAPTETSYGEAKSEAEQSLRNNEESLLQTYARTWEGPDDLTKDNDADELADKAVEDGAEAGSEAAGDLADVQAGLKEFDESMDKVDQKKTVLNIPTIQKTIERLYGTRDRMLCFCPDDVDMPHNT